MAVKISQTVQDYLKAIYEMTRDGERASTNGIASRMGVRAASATGMVQKLAGAEPPLVDYSKHRGVALTPDGEQIALEVIRHHRLVETYLHEKLGYSWDEVHPEADLLEHVISEDLEERIAHALGDPVYDPHGEPIPNREFQMPERHDVRLSALHPGDRAVVCRIQHPDPDLLRYLASNGLIPNRRVVVLGVSPFDDNFQLEVEGQEVPLVLGPRVTGQIYVEMDV